MSSLRTGAAVVVAALCATLAQAHEITPKVDAAVAAAMRQFKLPGVAVAVVRGHQVMHQRGYGLADVVSGAPVNTQTLFKLGSISKPITALALALLVEEGQLAWTDPLQRFIPELQAANSWVARLTVQQILAHQTGLNLEPLEALMWPQPNAFQFSQFLAGIAVLGDKAVDTFGFRYSNLNYLLAGEIIHRVSGQSYRDFVEKRIFAPLGMHCVGGGFRKSERQNAAQSHLLKDGRLQAVRVDADELAEGLDAAAGGVRCDVRAMARWLQLQLRGPGGLLPLSNKTWRQLHAGLVVTQTAFDKTDRPSELETYGLGLQIKAGTQDVRWDHYGGLAGAVAYFAVLPGADLGLAVMINSNAPAARNALVAKLLAMLAPAAVRPAATQSATPAAAAAATPAPVLRALDATTDSLATRLFGRYADAWFGEVQLCPQAGEATWWSAMSPRLTGRLRLTEDNRVALIWDDAGVDSDSVLQIQGSADKPVSAFELAPLSAQGLSDFDFSALHFKRVGECDAAQGTSQRAP
jgi:CubicO group peptidase (beta-lactamase class C family)